MRFIYEDGFQGGRALFMDGREMFFNWHYMLPYLGRKLLSLEIYADDPGLNVKSCIKVNSNMFDIERIADSRDLGSASFRFAPVTGIRDIWNMANSTSATQLHNVHRLVKANIGDKTHNAMEGPFSAMWHQGSPLSIRVPGTEIRERGLDFYLVGDGEGADGDCGFPYMASNLPQPLLGLHMGRLSNDSLIVPIFREDSKFHAAFQSLMPGMEEKIDFNAPGPKVSGASYIGKWTGQQSCTPGFSSIQQVLDDEDLHPHNYRPNLSQKARDNRVEATQNFGATVVDMSQTMMSDPEQLWQFLGRKPTDMPRVFEPYTFDEALFGNPERNIPSMASASRYVGWFFKGKEKRELVDFTNKTCHPDLRKRVISLKNAFVVSNPRVFVEMFAKDETLAFEKVHPENPDDVLCRLIYGHDLAYNILLRMELGAMIDYIVKHPAKTKTAIGVDPHSFGWQLLFEEVFKHPNVLAGDLKKEEATTGASHKTAFYTLCSMYYSWDGIYKSYMWNLLDTLDGYMFMKDGFVYENMNGHSSGHLLTTLYNSFCIWITHKYVFSSVEPNKVFEEHVELRATGDDTIGTVSDECKEKFNMITIAETLRSKFGMIYTDPQKSTELRPFITDVEDQSFLGRRFIKRDGKVFAPLRKTAIHDMLIYYVKTPGITKKVLIQQRTDAAFEELVTYGESEYNRYRALVLGKWANANHLKPNIPTWNKMMQRPHVRQIYDGDSAAGFIPMAD